MPRPRNSSHFARSLALFFALIGGTSAWAKQIFDLRLQCDHDYQKLAVSGALGFPLSSLPKYQETFLRDYLLPTVGRRAMYFGPNEHRVWRLRENGVTLSGFGPGQDINIVWIDKNGSPYFRIESNGNRTFFIPKDYDFAEKPEETQHFLLRALRGHTLHPYSKSKRAEWERKSLGEPGLLLKDTQREGVAAFHGAIDAGDDSFLLSDLLALEKALS